MPRIKYVEWNADYSMVALISKHQIVLANKQLEQLSAATEVSHGVGLKCCNIVIRR